VIYTQIDMHTEFGGVVPELASRAHIDKINYVVQKALNDAGKTIDEVDAVAVTYGPGLVGALLVGVAEAKAMAWAAGKPIIGVHHIEGHISANYIEHPELTPPYLGLIVSGGHTHLVVVEDWSKYRILGRTVDDAAGEAYDKVARAIGLGYPGGPKIDRIAREYISSVSDPSSLIPFPKGRPREGVSALAGLPAELCVSFSGLKTALLRYVQQNGGAEELTAGGEIPRIVASYQEAIVQALADRTRRALRRGSYRSLIVGGGVSLNSRLREVLQELAREERVELLTAKAKYCGDNGAMIAALAHYRRNLTGEAAMAVDVNPCLEVGG
jgi:N6-L-threonylcarbamoyladenine synthase